MSKEYGCFYCSGKRTRTTIPYGGVRVKVWCSICDMDMVSPVSKKKERQKAKKEIDTYKKK